MGGCLAMCGFTNLDKAILGKITKFTWSKFFLRSFLGKQLFKPRKIKFPPLRKPSFCGIWKHPLGACASKVLEYGRACFS